MATPTTINRMQDLYPEQEQYGSWIPLEPEPIQPTVIPPPSMAPQTAETPAAKAPSPYGSGVDLNDWSKPMFSLTATIPASSPNGPSNNQYADTKWNYTFKKSTSNPGAPQPKEYIDRRIDTSDVKRLREAPATITEETVPRPADYYGILGAPSFTYTQQPAAENTRITASGVETTPSPSTISAIKSQKAQALETEAALLANKRELADTEKQLQVENKKQGAADVAKNIASSGSDIFNELLQTNANYASANYAQKQAEWQQKGLSWFDPNQDLRPELDAYLDQMPSRREQLSEGTVTKGLTSANVKGDTGGGWWGWVANPAGAIVEKASGDEWQGVADYTWNQAVNRAMQIGGKTNSAYGYLAGAVVGIVEGVYNWNSAIMEDKENAKKARDAYLKKLQEWQVKRNQKVESAIAAGKEQARQYNLALAEKKKAAKKEAMAENRNKFVAAINNAMQNQQGNFQRSLSMWG